MTLEEFKAKVAALDDGAIPDEVDLLCTGWLRNALESNGNEGSIGIELLNVIVWRCMP